MTGLLELEDKLLIVGELFNTLPQVQTVFLFGSYGTEYQTPQSDIDFAIYFSENVTVAEEAALLNKLSIAMGTDRVDLVNLNKAPLILQFTVIAEGKIIYERDYNTTCDYHDYAITLNKFYLDYDQSFREAYLDGASLPRHR